MPFQGYGIVSIETVRLGEFVSIRQYTKRGCSDHTTKFCSNKIAGFKWRIKVDRHYYRLCWVLKCINCLERNQSFGLDLTNRSWLYE